MKSSLLTVSLASLSILAIACGDGVNECPSVVGVSITSPADNSTFTIDTDVDQAGIQIDVTATSTLTKGERATLTTGSDTATAEADADGNLSFADITVAFGSSTLTIDAVSECGTANDANTITAQLPPIASLSLTTLTREAARVDWTGNGDGGFKIKYDTSPIDDDNFDSNDGTIVEVATLTNSLEVSGLRAGRDLGSSIVGTSYYFAVAAIDSDGNRSTPVGGDVQRFVDFVATGPLAPPNAGDGDSKLHGYALAAGLFNDDPFYDIAAGAPYVGGTPSQGGEGSVYIYMGTADGIRQTPSYVITSGTLTHSVGWSLTSLHWVNDASCPNAGGECHELVVGAVGNGTVNIFTGGTQFKDPPDLPTPQTIPLANASTSFQLAGTSGWFGGGLLGATVARARFDGDDLDDLVMGVPGAQRPSGGDLFEGGVAIVYGGGVNDAPVTGVVSLSSTDTSNFLGARVHYYSYPYAAIDAGEDLTFSQFGARLFNIGKTNSTTDDIAIAPEVGVVTHRDAVYIWRNGGVDKPDPNTAVEVAFDSGRDLVIQASDAHDTEEYKPPFPPPMSLPDPAKVIRFGEAVSSISDRNEDLFRDIVVGVPREGPNNGAVYIVDGDQTGIHKIEDPADTSFTLMKIAGGPGGNYFGVGIVNNATAFLSPDIDMDGEEDFVIIGGVPTSPTIYIWYGETLATNTSGTTLNMDNASADHIIAAPDPDFNGHPRSIISAERESLYAIWAGDVNNDGLEDICWASALNAGPDGDRDGAIEVLYDDGN